MHTVAVLLAEVRATRSLNNLLFAVRIVVACKVGGAHVLRHSLHAVAAAIVVRPFVPRGKISTGFTFGGEGFAHAVGHQY